MRRSRSRVTKHPTVHLDPGVMAWLLNLTPQKITEAARPSPNTGTCSRPSPPGNLRS